MNIIMKAINVAENALRDFNTHKIPYAAYRYELTHAMRLCENCIAKKVRMPACITLWYDHKQFILRGQS